MQTTDEPLQLLTPTDGAEAQLARYGRYLGFPFSAVLRVGEVITGIRFEIRYLPLEAGECAFERQLGKDFDRLAEEGEIHVSINPDSATLTVYEIEGGIGDDRAWALFQQLARRLAEVGFSAGQECHYCHGQAGGHLVFQAGRVGQICQPCLEVRAQSLLREQTVGRHSIAQALKSVALGSFAVALGWLLCWASFDAFLRWTGPVGIPMEAMILAPLFLGVGFGALALSCGRRVMLGNPRIISALAAMSVVLGVSAGELCSVAWMVFQEFHVLSLRAAVVAYPAILKLTDGHYVAVKAVALCSAAVSPFFFKAARKPTLDL